MKLIRPLISVIIPVFNSEKYIKEALISVSEQTYSRIEIIVIDDHSSDGSGKIVSEFKNVKKFVLRKNMGVSFSRNMGVRESRGEFLTFLDADDYWVKDKLKFQIEMLLRDEKTDAVFGMFENFFEKGVLIPNFINKDSFLNPKNSKLKSLGTLMVRKKVFERVGYFPESLKVGEDLDWFIRADDYGVKLKFISKVLMYRRLHESNISYYPIAEKDKFIDIFRQSIKRKREPLK